MNLVNRKIWQQACGDTDRNYSSLCVQWDIILNGPGYAGRYPECDPTLITDGWTSKKRTDLRRFAQQMSDDDIVVLRLGTNTVVGIGVVVGGYDWQECFSDVDGWDLQHVRRVRWLWSDLSQPKLFQTYALKQGDTTQELTSQAVKQWIQGLNFPAAALTRPLVELPAVGRKVNEDEIAEYLFEQGVSSNSIENLMREFDELRRIAKWYMGKEAPSEFETLTYLVVPILRALGWTPQKMAIEWRNVDVALFDKLPRHDDNLSVVVEVKKKGNSCLSAFSQAERYAKGKANCKRLIVTDGLRYGVYIKQQGEYKLIAYFNLIELRENYPIYSCAGIKEALRVMTPEWRG